MPQIPQPFYANAAFILGSGGETIQPIEHGNGLSILLIEDNRNLAHDSFPDVRNNANIDQAGNNAIGKLPILSELFRFKNSQNVGMKIAPFKGLSTLWDYQNLRDSGVSEQR